ncbi:hypothetical protein CBR_g30537 [Chara braunii]|uniref:Uncharacterized protein n=1 Tax=Chara braunii TaxID=69332 RepID=A0A388LCY3_CHABU|nr:hypothetical protein CBR_g30537 [Chara braunii]|eukprot:GBG80171.1 hypothetical protein CBR_g30537 [Chara braunii]
MRRWAGGEAYEAEQRRLRELDTGAVQTDGGSQMYSGRPAVGVASERAAEGEHAPESGSGHDDGDQDAGADCSDGGDGREAPDQDIIDRVIVGLCAAHMEGGTQRAHDTLHVGDAIMEEEVGLHTDHQGSDTGARRCPVMEGGVHVHEEARLSPSWDAAGDMSLALIVRPRSSFYADDDHPGRRLDKRLGEGQGIFARGSSAGANVGDEGVADVGRSSVHTTTRILGLSNRQTRRQVVFPAPGAVEDRRRGLPYTSGEEGDLRIPAGVRRYGSISGLEAQIAAERQHLDELVQEQDRVAESETHGDEADTETESIDVVARRYRARRAAAVAAAPAAAGDPHTEPRHIERAAHGGGQSAPSGSRLGAARHGTRGRRSRRS